MKKPKLKPQMNVNIDPKIPLDIISKHDHDLHPIAENHKHEEGKSCCGDCQNNGECKRIKLVQMDSSPTELTIKK
ncbi:MAG: hypothetical protein ABI851_04310 [Saprospiraceae bacterium]